MRGEPLTEREHADLYQRALGNDAGDMAPIFAKLGCDDLVGAFRAMGWLTPLPYGEASQGESEILDAFWARMKGGKA